MTTGDGGYRQAMPKADQVLDGRYRLIEQIAAGGMGDVWRATDEMLRRTVAVKLMHDGRFGGRFRTEARAMAALHHPGVADVYDYGETTTADGTAQPYLVMACVEGQPLSDRIAERGALDPAEAMSVVAQTAQALQVVHDAGVIHRDVKPANLILGPDGRVVLIDFGVAVTPEAVDLTGAHEVVGTARYMAPEQVASEDITPAADIYALGAVAYHCLAGHPPYEGDNALAVALRHLDDDPPPLPADVPGDARRLVATAMAKDPAQRFPSASAMARAARAVGTPERPTAVVPSAHAAQPAPAPAPRRRSRWRTGLVTALAGVVAVAAALAFADPTGLFRHPLTGEPVRPAATSPPAESGSGSAGGTGGGVVPGTGPSRGTDVSGPTPLRPASGSRPAPSSAAGAGARPTPATSPAGGTGPTTAPTGGPTAAPTPEPTPETTTPPAATAAPAGAGG
jgi:predicted Ser/Thr protein kinase